MKSAQDVVRQDLGEIYNNTKKEFAGLAGKHLLITGGAGFLGYYLVQSVLNWNEMSEKSRQIRVTVLDNYIRGIPTWLQELEGNTNLVLINHDVTHPLPESIDNFQYIIHAASIASPFYYRQHPIETMDANVNGLRLLLDYCIHQQEKRNPIEGFLFFSSSEIYGNPPPQHIPTPESYYGYVSCTGPRACYDESKRYGESLCVNFVRQYDIPVKIARPFNNYGPGLKITDGRVIPDFVNDILADRNITMLSNGSPTRTFCYISDAIAGYYKILIKGRKGEAYNIGIDKPEISVGELANNIVKISKTLFNYKGEVLQRRSKDKDYLTDNPNRRCPSIAKARKHLGFNPCIPLDEGLRRSLIWYSENSSAEKA